MDLPQRFLDKVNITDSCWLWTAATRSGYGAYAVTHGYIDLAHRVAYRALKGEIPEGLEIDHLCRVRNCVNPDYLELVTRQQNVLRGLGPVVTQERHKAKTHCPKGHEYTEENTYRDYYKGYPRRTCRECMHIKNQNYYYNNKERLNAARTRRGKRNR